MPTYIQADKKFYKVQAVDRLLGGVELQHRSGWFEVGDENGRILGNPSWKWFSADDTELEGRNEKRRKQKKNKQKKVFQKSEPNDK